jgi:hypothetical protein
LPVSWALSWRTRVSARPMPRLASFWLICWSSMLVKVLVSWLSIGPSWGVASRMLFIIMLMNMDSNWVAAVFSASGEPVLADCLRSPRPLVSSANLPDRSWVEPIMDAFP